MLRHVSEKAQASLIIVALSFVLMSLFLSANFVGHTNQNASTENQVTEQKTEQAQRYKQDTSVYRMPNTTFGEKFEAGIEFMGGIRVINTLFVLAFGFITVSLIAHLVVIESAAKAWCDRFVHMIDT
jgi:multisubunit Na+/H+ antiporter MnhG subunit